MQSVCQKAPISQVRKLKVTGAALTLITILFTLTTTLMHAQIPTPNVLYSFVGGTTDVWEAVGILAQGRDGNLYGAAQRSGADGLGGVYKFDLSTQTATLVASFTTFGCQGLSLGFDGNFYGTCVTGGANNYGYVFKVTPGGTLTDIYDFTDANGDANPATVPVLGANGDFYGTTGVTNGACGNIYRVTTSGAYQYIQGGGAFCGATQLSAASNGNFYGGWGQTPTAGNRGAIFEVTESGTYDEIFDFSGTTASEYPTTGPILASNGKLIGNDDGGGTLGNGAIFSLTTNGKTLTDLYNIDSATDGSLWPNNLIQASDGNFYGASYGADYDNCGSFYELTSDNVFSSLALNSTSGNSIYGDSPLTPMTQHTNGTLYSTTSVNGEGGYGEFLSFDIGASAFIALVGPVPAGTEGTQVQILGQGFSSRSVVEFGGVPATKIQVSGGTFIIATIPGGALTGKITVKTGSSTLSTLSTYRIEPSTPSFSPASGAIGTPVTITGTGLTQTTKVSFNGTSAAFTVNSDTEISTSVPTGATTGKISVTTEGGTATSATAFTVE
jgi:uncharacterized repeat protein (TIGR03803 family)